MPEQGSSQGSILLFRVCTWGWGMGSPCLLFVTQIQRPSLVAGFNHVPSPLKVSMPTYFFLLVPRPSPSTNLHLIILWDFTNQVNTNFLEFF